MKYSIKRKKKNLKIVLQLLHYLNSLLIMQNLKIKYSKLMMILIIFLKEY